MLQARFLSRAGRYVTTCGPNWHHQLRERGAQLHDPDDQETRVRLPKLRQLPRRHPLPLRRPSATPVIRATRNPEESQITIAARSNIRRCYFACSRRYRAATSSKTSATSRSIWVGTKPISSGACSMRSRPNGTSKSLSRACSTKTRTTDADGLLRAPPTLRAPDAMALVDEDREVFGLEVADPLDVDSAPVNRSTMFSARPRVRGPHNMRTAIAWQRAPAELLGAHVRLQGT